MGYLTNSVISVICVISVMGELHLPCLRGAVGFIADTSWGEYGIVMLHKYQHKVFFANYVTNKI